MRNTIAANAAQARQTKYRLANPNEKLSYELGKAVQELPPLYTRLLAATISCIVFGAIAWAHYSEVDEVATAPGELIASSQVRPVTSLGNGTIVSVKVKEGDRVNKGQVLVERDPDLQQTEVARLTKAVRLIQEDVRRLDAERLGSGTSGSQLQDELLASRLRDFEARQAAAEAEAQRQLALIDQARVRLQRLQENRDSAITSLANARTNLTNAQSIVAKVSENLGLAERREQSLRILNKENAIPRMDYLEAKERLNRSQAEITRSQDEVVNAQNKVTEAQDRAVSLDKDMAAQTQEIRQAQAAYESVRKQIERLASERQSEILTQLNKRQEELANVTGQLETAKKQKQSETVIAPVSGTIYSVKATRGPIQSGEEMLSILPDGEDLLLEVKVLNRDIGFIRQGMKAKVKMATFSFQEFGTIDGEVASVSPNAIVDKELGLVFPTRIRLKKHSVVVRGNEVKFTPGMAASGEIVTRKKSVLTFVLEPITKRWDEAFSVR